MNNQPGGRSYHGDLDRKPYKLGYGREPIAEGIRLVVKLQRFGVGVTPQTDEIAAHTHCLDSIGVAHNRGSQV